MDIQLYNYKNEYGPDGKLKKVYDDNPNSIVAVVTVNGKKIYLGGDLDNVYGAEDRLGPQNWESRFNEMEPSPRWKSFKQY